MCIAIVVSVRRVNRRNVASPARPLRILDVISASNYWRQFIFFIIFVLFNFPFDSELFNGFLTKRKIFANVILYNRLWSFINNRQKSNRNCLCSKSARRVRIFWSFVRKTSIYILLMPFLFAILEFTLRNVMLRDEITTNLQTLVLLLLCITTGWWSCGFKLKHFADVSWRYKMRLKRFPSASLDAWRPPLWFAQCSTRISNLLFACPTRVLFINTHHIVIKYTRGWK